MRRRWEAYLIEWNISDLQPTANRSVEQHPGSGPPDCVIGHHKRRWWIEEQSICRHCHRPCCHCRAHPWPVPFHCTATMSQMAIKGETIHNYLPTSQWPSSSGGGQRDTAPIAQGTGRQGRRQSQPGIFAWLNSPVNGWWLIVVCCHCPLPALVLCRQLLCHINMYSTILIV